MSITCTRCEGAGFLNINQIDDSDLNKFQGAPDFCAAVLKWIESNKEHDVSICDCCGDGESWYGIPGEHYNQDDPGGFEGPYAYNGGLCECN